MAPEPTWITTSTVLRRLGERGDEHAWIDFVHRFRGPLLAYFARRGVSESDADDIAQDALATFAEAYRSGAYDRGRGRLSRWLFGIARFKLQKFRERARAQRADELRAPADWSAVIDNSPRDPDWEEAWERAMFEQALRVARGEFQEQTWRVFECIVIESRSVEDVEREMGLTRNAIYIAKHRVLSRVQALLVECDEVS